ncbi:hypothetical protein BDN72DRAFT_266573 [Pluteus cervinus]|uniref:Uncharacterized protein n=1 Tax=Pluteus cervinus TaxID=181527 RepID=A0ACD3B5I7_9AGAR|nr:hypothetical protein BDN72DRAFT_266573 [Pluteus cervinus]
MSSSYPAQHVLRQLKLVIPGGAITYYLGTIHHFLDIVSTQSDSWGSTVARIALLNGLATITLFLYVLVIHWKKGVQPNYRSWRESGVLSLVIPTLTASIVVGWMLSVFVLGGWSSLGYAKGIVGALYALTFGLLGLVPAPKVKRT